jgi:hypothetical protein
MNELPDRVLTMDDLSYDGERYIYRCTLNGRNAGTGGTGNTVHISGYEEWSLSVVGLTQRSQGHMDLNDYARQLAGESPQGDVLYKSLMAKAVNAQANVNVTPCQQTH